MENKSLSKFVDEEWSNNFPSVAKRGIDETLWNALTNTIYPGANENSILMAVDYCKSRKLDILLKPVHLVPMSVLNKETDKYEFQDTVMPGIGLYRIQAERSGTYAGCEAPKYGPIITKNYEATENKKQVKFSLEFPEWCEYTVYKQLKDGPRVPYIVCEYWEENYATQSKWTDAPNKMWRKRPRAQLAKCAESQALRKAWPEVGQQVTAEEMEGKDFIDITPTENNTTLHEVTQKTIEHDQDGVVEQSCTDEKFNEIFEYSKQVITSGKKSADQIIQHLAKQNHNLTQKQVSEIRSLEV